jgi:UDP-N-acetylmuramate dehydrogenase
MRVVHQCDLTDYNAYRLPARCDIAYFPESINDVVTLVRQLHGQPYVLLGSGHNVILARSTYTTPFVIFQDALDQFTIDGTRVQAGAGVFTRALCEATATAGLSGLEVFYDIPSSLGGAVVMNAGAYGHEIRDVLVAVTAVDSRTGAVETMARDQLDLAYRHSRFQEQPYWIVVAVELELQRGDRDQIRADMERIKTDRWQKQPRDYPNAGSVFKRPQGRYVGPMIDQLGLKGKQVGGFRVSPKHGGFIEKVGDGTGAELMALIGEVKTAIDQAFDVDLELEQRVIDAP